mmetsp:Transcript_35594/g.57184  ORF Transcript_35594/g.57184 Transcript_35594/m.57184 type:complete len:541 (+) Transcript_35594:219-1841(+)
MFLRLLRLHGVTPFLHAFAPLSGCDYPCKAKRLGPKRAMQLIERYGVDLRDIVNSVTANPEQVFSTFEPPDNWLQKLDNAVSCFVNPLIYDPLTKTQRCLTDAEAWQGKEDILGKPCVPGEAEKRALGLIDQAIGKAIVTTCVEPVIWEWKPSTEQLQDDDDNVADELEKKVATISEKTKSDAGNIRATMNALLAEYAPGAVELTAGEDGETDLRQAALQIPVLASALSAHKHAAASADFNKNSLSALRSSLAEDIRKAMSPFPDDAAQQVDRHPNSISINASGRGPAPEATERPQKSACSFPGMGLTSGQQRALSGGTSRTHMVLPSYPRAGSSNHAKAAASMRGPVDMSNMPKQRYKAKPTPIAVKRSCAHIINVSCAGLQHSMLTSKSIPVWGRCLGVCIAFVTAIFSLYIDGVNCGRGYSYRSFVWRKHFTKLMFAPEIVNLVLGLYAANHLESTLWVNIAVGCGYGLKILVTEKDFLKARFATPIRIVSNCFKDAVEPGPGPKPETDAEVGQQPSNGSSSEGDSDSTQDDPTYRP